MTTALDFMRKKKDLKAVSLKLKTRWMKRPLDSSEEEWKEKWRCPLRPGRKPVVSAGDVMMSVPVTIPCQGTTETDDLCGRCVRIGEMPSCCSTETFACFCEQNPL